VPAADEIGNFETVIESSEFEQNYAIPKQEKPKNIKHDWELPYVCDRFEYIANEKKSYYKRIRGRWTRKDVKRNKKLARMVANEMGADYRFLEIAMERASGFNPHVIHILNPDIEAHKDAYSDYYWTKEKEESYRRTIDKGPRTEGFYEARRDLARILVYKNNPFYKKNISYDIVTPDGKRHPEGMPFFHYGYGPLDMNSVYYTKRWDKNAPPWIMCNHDGIIAFVTMIWSLREYQEECEAKGKGDTWGVVDRRYARGKCGEASQAFRRRARAQKKGLDPDARARLGKKYSADHTGRDDLLEFLLEKAQEECLLSAGNKECLERKKTKPS
jgi:hypothetical protein